MTKQQTTKALSEPIREVPRDNSDIVIIGNGVAGITAALEVRRLAPEKHVAVITDQSHPTIYTPALKQFAIGKIEREQLLVHPAGTEHAHHIYMMNARVAEIKTRENCLYLNNGQTFGYGSLLLATGSSPVGLASSLPGSHFDGILTLHRLSDYLNLRHRLHEVKEAVVIGGGLLAMETVMVLLKQHVRVHWLIRSEIFLPHMLDYEASSIVIDDCRRAGAWVQTGVEVVGIVGKVGAVAGIMTNHGQFLPCQLVIACTGSQPVTTLATHCDVPLEEMNGFLVNSYLHTNVENIFAAGDCALFENTQTGEYQSSMQWHSALLQGRIAAAVMTEQDTIPSMGVAWHKTQIGSLPMLSVGSPLNAPKGTTYLTNRNKRKYRRLAFYDNRLIGYLALGGRQPDSFALKQLIDEGHSIRGIEKELLMGDFHDHRYFFHIRQQAQQRRMPTEKLRAIHPSSVKKVSRVTEARITAISIVQTSKKIDIYDKIVDDTGPKKEIDENVLQPTLESKDNEK